MSGAAERMDRDGYVVGPGILSSERLEELRAQVAALFAHPSADPEGGPGARSRIYVLYPQLRWVLEHPPLVEAVRSAIGADFVYLTETAAHDNHFGEWHKDTTGLEAAGNRFHRRPDFRLAQAALYLQDNGEFGGGLDVVPGSYLRPDPFVRDRLHHPSGFGACVEPGGPLVPLRARQILAGLRASLLGSKPVGTGVTIPSRAGDLVLFDLRITHRLTETRQFPPPPEHRKLALFMVVGTDTECVRLYERYIRTRQDYGAFKHGGWSPELREWGRAHGLRFSEVD